MPANRLTTISNVSSTSEVARLQKPLIVRGDQGNGGSASANRSASKLLVRGKSDQPIIAAASYGQSLLSTVDRRVRVLDTDAQPWRMICSLFIESDGGPYVGTGWLAGPRTVITAGHCVFDHASLGGWAKKITVTPGKDDADLEPFGSFESKTFRSVGEWVKKGDTVYDYGAIILDEPIGDKIGFFSFGYLPDDALKSHLVNVSGYPADHYGQTQMHHKNRIKSTTDTTIFYDVDSTGGQSGSPVWLYPEQNIDHPLVVGIHAYGAGAQHPLNSGPRITADVIEQIEKWRGEP